MQRIGIFLCQCEYHQLTHAQIQALKTNLGQLAGVVYIDAPLKLCREPAFESLALTMQTNRLNAVIVTSCLPTAHEYNLNQLSTRLGLNPQLVQMVAIPHANNGHKADLIPKLSADIQAAWKKLAAPEHVAKNNPMMVKKALIIGGGVAGIHVALDIADAGYQVYLVERSSSIGGHMVQMSEVFPTLDCPQCILTPKMVACYQHPNIKILAYSEIEAVTGQVGNFQVKIKHKTPYIDWEKCTGCGECNRVCTVSYPSEFDRGVVDQRAAFKPFAQAVPNKLVIQKKGLSPCKNACPIDCNAQGYVALIAHGHFQEAIRLVRERIPFPGVLGRVCNHRCQSECLRGGVDEAVAIKFLKRFLSDWEMRQAVRPIPKPTTIHPERVAIIGSGPAGLTAAYDLAKAGYLSTVFEALAAPGGMLKWGIPDYRLPREILDFEIQLVREMGVEIKCNTPIGPDLTPADLFQQGFRAIFMAPGAHKSLKLGVAGEEAEGVIDCIQFLRDINGDKPVTLGDRVGIIGGGNAAIDAARTAKRLGSKSVTIIYRRTRAEMPADNAEIEAARHEGIELLILTAPTQVLVENGKMVALECVRNELGAPDKSGRRRPVPIPGSEFRIELDQLIPAISQEPDLTFLPPEHQFEISKWNTFVVDEKTLATNIPGIFAGGDAVSGPKTVVEAMEAGHIAAEMIIKYIHGEPLQREIPAHLPVVEKVDYRDESTRLKPAEMPEVAPELRVADFREVELGFSEAQAIAEARRCLACGGCSECRYCETVCEPRAINQSITDSYETLNVGAMVVATGYELLPRVEIKEFQSDPDILDPIQFERLLAPGGPTAGEIYRPSDGKVPKTVVFISCTGSRDPERHLPYCSRVCCMYSLKMGMLYKHVVHDGQVFNFYMDVRCDGKMYEEFYQRGVEEDGIIYLRGQVSKLYREGDKIMVWGTDTILGKKVEIEADLVVLALAMIARPETRQLAEILGVQLNEWGFLQELQPRLRPMESNVPGIFIAGTAQAPKDIPECVAHAAGCAGKVLTLFAPSPTATPQVREVIIAEESLA
ncbi:FAD-dependent oxidoreductase [candidate division KSB1 bacterium]|nr:FAD-dependent oxidoreductase [candidate division KSB1 bacterium]